MKQALYSVLAVIVIASAIIVGVKVRERANEFDVKSATQAAVQQQLDMLKQQRPDAFKGKDGKKLEANYRRQIEEQVAINELIKKEAEAIGQAASKTEVETAISQVRMSYGGEDKFNAALKTQGYTLERYQQSIKDQITLSKMMAHIVKTVKVTDAEVKAFYNANIAQYADEHDPNKKKSFKDVAPTIKEQLTKEKQREKFNEYITGLREKL